MIGENIKRVCQFFGSAAIMVLLQPSVELYNVFDYVLVLTQGGRQAYFGTMRSHHYLVHRIRGETRLAC
jgi:hypothetical protein